MVISNVCTVRYICLATMSVNKLKLMKVLTLKRKKSRIKLSLFSYMQAILSLGCCFFFYFDSLMKCHSFIFCLFLFTCNKSTSTDPYKKPDTVSSNRSVMVCNALGKLDLFGCFV